MPTAVERLDLGRAAFARSTKALLGRNNLSHSDLKLLHDWASPDAKTWLSTSQVSGLRTQKLKAPGPRLFDALGQLNLRLAGLAGDQSPVVAALTERPLLPRDLARLQDSAWFLQSPDTGLPMTAGDLFMVWIGRLDPGVADDGYSDRQARAITERLALEVQRWIVAQSKLPSQARPLIEDFYGVHSQMRRERLWAALMGGSALDGERLAEERPDLMRLLGGLSCGRPLIEAEWHQWERSGSLPAE